jgi:membrane protease YdiL (CAAX protease family)
MGKNDEMIGGFGMNKLTQWIKTHQIMTFFIITFAISWGLGFTWEAVMNEGIFLLAPLAFIAACGPALAGIIISTMSNTQPKEGTKRTYWIAFLVAWVLSALVFLANNTFINHAPFSPIMLIFTLISVVPVAFVISMIYSRIPTVRNYLSSLIRLRSVWGWALLALILTPLLVLVSILIKNLLDQQPITAYQLPTVSFAMIGLITIKFLYQFFFFNATGEETGWRGFALPKMQSRISPLVACLIMNLFWALWHLFPWMAEGRPVFSLGYWAQTYLELFPGTVTLCWIYNRSKGSILVAGVAHAAANTAYWLFPNLDWPVFNWTVAAAALVMILVDRMWKKLPPDHKAVFTSVPMLELIDDSVFLSPKLSQEK